MAKKTVATKTRTPRRRPAPTASPTGPTDPTSWGGDVADAADDNSGELPSQTDPRSWGGGG